MAEKDLAHVETDKILLALEQKINRIYANARDDMSANIAEYFASFKKREARQRKLLEQGKITEQEFKQWRLNQMARGERYVKMRDEYAERMTNANEVATAYINDTTPNIYSLNRNYTAYTIEQVAGDVGFTLYDERTVKRLIKDEPNLMPYYPPKKAIKRGIDLEYGKQKITENITSGILQGKSIPNISKSLQQDIPTMNRNSAIRTARTAATGAQNAGRMDSYHAAKEMGIKLKKQWLATLDGRTRHEHAMLDGQAVDEDKPFKVDGYEIMFPGDPSAAAEMVYNCRCTTVAQIEGVDMSDIKRRAVDPETGETVLIENMTYAEWAGWKEKGGQVQTATAKTHYEEYKENEKEIQKTLHKVEEERRNLDYEVGTIIDRSGKVISVSQGEAHEVSVDETLIKDSVFTHNHPSGGCFSDQDIYSAIQDGVLELRASTPQGTFYSLLRKDPSLVDVAFADEYKDTVSIMKAIDAVQQDLIDGKITKKEVDRRGFGMYIEYMSKLGDEYLQKNAERFGYVYTKGKI